MTNPNEHIIDYLDWYIGLEKPPGFAVMLSGEWGSGKTYFIEQYQNHVLGKAKAENVEPREFLYISLNGLRSTDEINKEIFFSLHPSLDNNAVGILGRIAVTAGKALGIDLPEENELIKKLIGRADGKILIFDDLERYNPATSSVEEVFGYLNRFVEHAASSVIVVCNESQFSGGLSDEGQEVDSERQLNARRYFEIKEKVVAKTLGIVPDVQPALNIFLDNVPDKRSKEFLTLHRDRILEVFVHSGADNLRILKHQLLDFDRFYRQLVLAVKDIKGLSTETLEDLLQTALLQHLCFSIDIGKNRVKVDDLLEENLYQTELSTIREAMNSPKKGTLPDGIDRASCRRLGVTIQRYEEIIDFGHYGIPIGIWRKWLSAGYFDKEGVVQRLANSSYVVNQPLWARLWNWLTLDDDEFSSVMSDVREQLSAGKVTHPGEFLHLAGTFLQLSGLGLIEENQSQVQKIFIKQVGEQSFEKVDVQEWKWPHNSYGGMGFAASDTPEFRSVKDAMLEKVSEQILVESRGQIPESVKQLETNPRAFIDAFTPNNQEAKSIFTLSPALQHVDPKTFFGSFLKVPNKDKYSVFYVFEKRAKNPMYDPELPFLKGLKSELEQYLRSSGKVPSTEIIRQLAEKHLEDAIREIESRIDERGKEN